MECTSHIKLASCAAWFICRFVSQCFGYNPCLFHHGVCLRCRCDFQFVGFYPCFEMSCPCDPHFSCCGWRVGFVCDRWWLFSHLWLLCRVYMRFNLLYCLSGLCLSYGVSKLNWWGIVFSTSGGVNVFCWVWHLIWLSWFGGSLWFALALGKVLSFVIENPWVLVAALLSWKIGVYHPYDLV
jgi:hypothetical protein